MWPTVHTIVHDLTPVTAPFIIDKITSRVQPALNRASKLFYVAGNHSHQ